LAASILAIASPGQRSKEAIECYADKASRFSPAHRAVVAAAAAASLKTAAGAAEVVTLRRPRSASRTRCTAPTVCFDAYSNPGEARNPSAADGGGDANSD